MRSSAKIGSAVALALALTGSSARADPVSAGQWYAFLFDGPGSFGRADSRGYYQSIVRSVPAPAASWTFTSATPFTFSIQDLTLTGDRFSLLAGGALVGATSPTAPGASCTTGGGELAVVYIANCQALPLSSRGTFAFAPGSYAFDIRADESPSFGGGVAAFRLDVTAAVVPEPSTFALLAGGLALVGGAAARARSRRGT